jgi:cyclic pyranopterin phosphate synthase
MGVTRGKKRRQAKTPVRAVRTGRTQALSHLDARGHARMVDVSAKEATAREAVARGEVRARAATLRRITTGRVPKGDVLAAARLAGIMAAKRTPDLVPLCHPLPLSAVEVDVVPDREESCVRIESRVRLVGKTGVEMEALLAVTVAALTVYDMCKAIDREMTIESVRLVRKTGGKSGTFTRRGEPI